MYISHVTGDDTPLMKELYINVVHQYASQWKQLGLKLGLQQYDINNISEDHTHITDRSIMCCIAVLKKWLQSISSPTSWGKLDDVIKTLTIPKGMLYSY